MNEYDWLIFGYSAWRAWQGRPHHFARLLARRGQVLFVDPPLSVLSTRRMSPAMEHVGRNVRCLRLSAGLPGNWRRPIHVVNHGRWRGQIARAIRQTRMGRDRPLVGLIELPIWDMVPGAAPADLWVYDCVDAFRYIPPNRPAYVDDCERRLVPQVDLCVCVSKPLVEQLRSFGGKAALLPNACEPDHFAQAATLPPHADVADLPRPRMLFVGGIDQCVDTDALLAAAEVFAQGSLVLVGPPQTPDLAARLGGRPNVHLLGRRPYEQLPAFMAGSDLLLLPFKTTAWGVARDNIKLYEYLAAGLPIASTDLPRAHDFAGLVEIAPCHDGPAGFADACRRAMDGDRPELRAARRSIARGHTWPERVRTLQAMVDEAIRGSG